MAFPDGNDLRRLGWGFALSGGGAKGAYAVGVVRAFEQAGVFGDGLAAVRALHGVSTGALVAALAALGRFEELERIYTSVETRDVLRPSHRLAYRLRGKKANFALSALLGPSYVFSTKPLRALVERHMGEDLAGFREILARKDRLDVGFVSVDLADGSLKSLGNGNLDDPALLFDAMIASASMPVLMDLVTIGGHAHADGGVREFLPVQRVLKSRFAARIDVVVAVPLDAPRVPEGEATYEKILDVLGRTVEILSYDVGDSDIKGAQFVDALLRVREALLAQGPQGEALWNDAKERFQPYVHDFLDDMRRKKEAFEFITVQPERLDFEDTLEFRPGEMRRALAQGREDGRKALEAWWEGRGHRCAPKSAS